MLKRILVKAEKEVYEPAQRKSLFRNQDHVQVSRKVLQGGK